MKKSFSLILLASFLFLGCVAQSQPSEGTLDIAVIINNGSANVSETVAVANGSTAFQAFTQAATLSIQDSKYGIFVTGVNGLEQDHDAGLYWQYYVDGELAPVGVAAYVLTEDCTLEFRYEKPPEFLS